MDLCLNLLSSCIALAGLTSVFLVFRWDAIDNFVDNRKTLLRYLLENEIKARPDIILVIQEIGKSVKISSLTGPVIELNTDADFLKFFDKLTIYPINRYISEICKVRSFRRKIIRFGLISIISLISLSLYYLASLFFNSGFFISIIAIRISIIVFFITLIITTIFIYISVNGKPIPKES